MKPRCLPSALPNLSKAVRHFAPSWFTIVMGTGIVGVLIAQFPYDTPAKIEVGWAFWWLSLVQFSAFCAMLSCCFVFFPADALKLFDEPAQAMFLGAIPPSVSGIITGLLLFMAPRWDHDRVVAAAVVLWWINTGLALLCTILLPFSMFVRRQPQFKLEFMTAVSLVPLIPSVVAAGSGGTVAQAASPGAADNIIHLSCCCILLWGVCSVLTLYHGYNGTLFYTPCLTSCEQAVTGERAADGAMASVVTFSRKSRKATSGDGSAAGSDAGSTASTYVTAPSVLTPVPDSPAVEQDENAGASSTAKSGGRSEAGGAAGRWRRKNAAERAEQERRQHLAEMRAYFEEVDAFELAVETPPAPKARGQAAAQAQADRRTPPRARQAAVGQALAAAAPTPGTALRQQRAMSLGLSRRRSSMVAWPIPAALASSSKANQSPLKLNVPLRAMQEQQDGVPAAARRSTLGAGAPGPHRLSVAADNAGMGGSPWAVNRHSLATRGRRSSVAPSRLSGTGKMLSRLSVGLTDALQWLGIRGKIPAAGAAAAPMAEAAAADRPALSPIASPGGEEGGSEAGDSPLAPQSVAVTALEQLPADSSAAAASPVAAEAAAEEADVAEGSAEEEAAAAAAVSPLAAATPGAADVAAEGAAPSEEEEAAAEQAAEAAAAEPEAAPASPVVEALGHELQAKLQLQEEQQAAVQLGEPAAEAEAAVEDEEAEELTPLQQLLVLCGQETDPALLPSMDDLLGKHVDLKKVRKIGEGTFGEAFKAGGVVLKIVPMEGSVLVNGEPQKRADEILAEVSVTLTLSRLNGAAAAPGEAPANVTTGFVETYGVGVCRGAYSEALCREWHRWDKENESENEPVDVFAGLDDQLFVVFVVADGGADLEHFELRTFEEVRSILLQTALAVAVAEEACQFEHRDLHWGNLLIRRSEEPAATAAVGARLRGVDLEAGTSGVTVTLIDFTLSRLVTVTGEVAFCDLAADPELFKGPKGSVQAETYRRMKKATKNRWEAHVPATNVFWLQYLVDICMTEKKGWACRKEDLNALRAFKRRCASYDSCAELLFDEFLRASLLIAEGA